MELTNIHPGAIDEMYKIASISLCPNVVGQVGGFYPDGSSPGVQLKGF